MKFSQVLLSLCLPFLASARLRKDGRRAQTDAASGVTDAAGGLTGATSSVPLDLGDITGEPTSIVDLNNPLTALLAQLGLTNLAGSGDLEKYPFLKVLQNPNVKTLNLNVFNGTQQLNEDGLLEQVLDVAILNKNGKCFGAFQVVADVAGGILNATSDTLGALGLPNITVGDRLPCPSNLTSTGDAGNLTNVVPLLSGFSPISNLSSGIIEEAVDLVLSLLNSSDANYTFLDDLNNGTLDDAIAQVLEGLQQVVNGTNYNLTIALLQNGTINGTEFQNGTNTTCLGVFNVLVNLTSDGNFTDPEFGPELACDLLNNITSTDLTGLGELGLFDLEDLGLPSTDGLPSTGSLPSTDGLPSTGSLPSTDAASGVTDLTGSAVP